MFFSTWTPQDSSEPPSPIISWFRKRSHARRHVFSWNIYICFLPALSQSCFPPFWSHFWWKVMMVIFFSILTRRYPPLPSWQVQDEKIRSLNRNIHVFFNLFAQHEIELPKACFVTWQKTIYSSACIPSSLSFRVPVNVQLLRVILKLCRGEESFVEFRMKLQREAVWLDDINHSGAVFKCLSHKQLWESCIQMYFYHFCLSSCAINNQQSLTGHDLGCDSVYPAPRCPWASIISIHDNTPKGCKDILRSWPWILCWVLCAIALNEITCDKLVDCP